MASEADKAWEKYKKKYKPKFRGNNAEDNFFSEFREIFKAGQMAKCKSISTDESEAFTKSKGNVDFSLSEEEIYSHVSFRDPTSLQNVMDIAYAIAKYLEEREKGKQLDLVKAERERIRNKLESKMLEVMESVHDKYTMEQVCDILDEVKKEIEGDEEHAEKENNKIKECKHKYADWCHNTKYDEQEKCPFYDFSECQCRDFEEKEKPKGRFAAISQEPIKKGDGGKLNRR